MYLPFEYLLLKQRKLIAITQRLIHKIPSQPGVISIWEISEVRPPVASLPTEM